MFLIEFFAVMFEWAKKKLLKTWEIPLKIIKIFWYWFEQKIFEPFLIFQKIYFLKFQILWQVKFFDQCLHVLYQNLFFSAITLNF